MALALLGDGTGGVPEVRAGEGFQALRDEAGSAIVDVYRLRSPRPPDSGDDLREVIYVAALVVSRHLLDDEHSCGISQSS